jgi:protein Tob/BTG
MKYELQSAANFLIHLVRLGRRNVGETQLEKFRQSLVEVLRRRYRDHWFPERPFKGSGYRCIRINGKMDPVIAQAGDSCGLSPQLIHATFPSELTMWIDPLEVSYRIGENGSVCVLYEFKEGVTNEPWRPSSASLAACAVNGNTATSSRKTLKMVHKPSTSESSSPASSGSPAITPPPTAGVSSGSQDSNQSSSHHQQHQQQQQHPLGKEALRSKMELLLASDPSRSAVSIEQLAAFVASA